MTPARTRSTNMYVHPSGRRGRSCTQAMAGAREMSILIAMLVLVWAAGTFAVARADKPCAARAVPGRSVVCVCNATYCDEVAREPPAAGRFVAYTSSEGGLRFSKTSGELESSDSSTVGDVSTIRIDAETTYQKIKGFGGAVTDSAGLNWVSLPDAQKQFLIDSYCSDRGLEYNLLRVPIGGSDFSTHAYTYNETPEDDMELSNFTLSMEDYNYKLPMLKACLSAAPHRVRLLASVWSPPVWMKTNREITGVSLLRDGYYDAFALYFIKFIQQYSAAGVPVWAVTTTNEPVNGLATAVPFNDLGFTVATMAKWIKTLGPALRREFPALQILAVDDQRPLIAKWFEAVVKLDPETLQYIDGIAVHWYYDKSSPASILSGVAEKYPDKFILGTEACSGADPTDLKKVDLGSWSRAKDYVTDILEDLNNQVTGWIDWNLALDEQGGPNWVSNFVDAPIIVTAASGEFLKQPMFYAMGHFSKFLPPGSTRLHVEAHLLQQFVKHVAFLSTRDTIVVVLYNQHDDAATVALQVGPQQATVELPADSVTTVELPYEQSAGD